MVCLQHSFNPLNFRLEEVPCEGEAIGYHRVRWRNLGAEAIDGITLESSHKAFQKDQAAIVSVVH